MDSGSIWFYSEFMDAETGQSEQQLQGGIGLKPNATRQRSNGVLQSHITNRSSTPLQGRTTLRVAA